MQGYPPPHYIRSNTGGGGKPSALRIGKGLVDKVLQTGIDGGDSWEVENLKETKEVVKKVDTEMSLKG